MNRGKRETAENRPSLAVPAIPATMLVKDFDEVAIRPSPQKPFETAESPNRELLALSPCEFCGRKFNSTNLSRHRTICERLAHKPKREAFVTIAQRLAHVAQEDAVRPVIQQGLERKTAATDEESHHKENRAVKKSSAQSGKTRPGRTGADLFREQQKGHSKCQYCERTFREEAYTRHVEFCKSQAMDKLHRSPKEDPRSDLLLRRIKYRPPLPRTNSKESGELLPRKAMSAFSSAQKAATRPADLKILGSQSAMAGVHPPGGGGGGGGKTPADIAKLTGKLQSMIISDYSSPTAGVNGQQRQRIITPYQDRTSPSDYGSGESLLDRSRAGSLRVSKTQLLTGITPNGINRQVVTTLRSNNNVDYDGSGNGNAGSYTRVKNGTQSAAVGNKSVAAENVHKIYHSGDLLSRTGSFRSKKSSPVSAAAPMSMPVASFSKTMGHKGSGYGMSALEEAIRAGKTPEKYTVQKFAEDVAKTPVADRPYPFNVALAQKEEMRQIHRSNSVRAKNSSDSSNSVDWDTFLKPAVLRSSESPEQEDKYRLFQWEGDRFSAPKQRNPVKLSDYSRDESRIFDKDVSKTNGNGHYEESFTRRRNIQPWKPDPTPEESLEETDNTSDSVSPISPSPMGSVNSIKSSAIGSSLSSFSGTQQKFQTSSPMPPKFCHNCGNEFPIPNAAFCCHCGMARLVSRIPI